MPVTRAPDQPLKTNEWMYEQWWVAGKFPESITLMFGVSVIHLLFNELTLSQKKVTIQYNIYPIRIFIVDKVFTGKNFDTRKTNKMSYLLYVIFCRRCLVYTSIYEHHPDCGSTRCGHHCFT